MGKSKSNCILNVVLDDHDVAVLTKQAKQINEIAAGLLTDLARGGVMIPPEYATRIETAIQSVDAPAIVEAVEKSINRQGDATVVSWVVDPTQIQFYQSLADNAGVSLERQLKSLLDYAYSQGWFGMGAPDVDKLLLSPEQFRELQAMFGKDIPTGEDVMNALRGNSAGRNLPAADEDDIVFEALRGK